MQRSRPRSGLAAGYGEIIGMARRYNSGLSWPSGSFTGPAFDVIDWDPYGLYSVGGGAPFDGRFVVINFIRCSFVSAGGTLRYMRMNIGGVYTCYGRFAFTTTEQSLMILGGFVRAGKGNAFTTELFQDSGSAVNVAEFEQAVFYAGDN